MLTVRLIPQCRSLTEALDHARALDRAGLLSAPLSARLLTDLTEAFGEVDLPAAAVPAVLGQSPAAPRPRRRP